MLFIGILLYGNFALSRARRVIERRVGEKGQRREGGGGTKKQNRGEENGREKGRGAENE